MVDGLARFHVGGYEPKRSWVGIERLEIKQIKLFGHLMVAEIGTKQVARAKPRSHTAIAPIVGKALIIAQGAAGLPALVVATKGCSCRNANHAIEENALLGEHIDDAHGVEPTQCAAFEH